MVKPCYPLAILLLLLLKKGAGLSVNLKKCSLWGPGSSKLSTLSIEHPLRQVTTKAFSEESGVQVVGVPIGRNGERGFQAGAWANKVRDLGAACEALTGVPAAQVQHCLLRLCLDAAKLQYLLRTVGLGGPEV